MAKDIVCVEAELSIAANNIVEYGDFLVRTIESYIAVLAEIQENGIQDDLICAELSSIAQSLDPYRTSIIEECEMIAKDVKEYVLGIEQADNFKFPRDILAAISSFVSDFL